MSDFGALMGNETVRFERLLPWVNDCFGVSWLNLP